MYTRIFFAARNHFIYTTLRSFEEFWGALTHGIQTLKCDVVSFGVIASNAKQSRTQTGNVRLFRSELVISECVIFYAELRKNTLGGKKYAFNQMLRICRERERPLLSLFFIFLSSKIRLFTYQYHNISLTKVNLNCFSSLSLFYKTN